MLRGQSTDSQLLRREVYAALTLACLTLTIGVGPAFAQTEPVSGPPQVTDKPETKAALPETQDSKTSTGDALPAEKPVQTNGGTKSPEAVQSPTTDAVTAAPPSTGSNLPSTESNTTTEAQQQESQPQDDDTNKRKKKRKRKSDEFGHDHSDKAAAALIPTTTLPPGQSELHKMQTRLSGSMCLSCLYSLKKKLMGIDGIAFVKIDRPVHNVYQPYAPDVSSWADSIIIYDLGKATVPDLRAFIRQQGYITYKVTDRLLDKPVETYQAEEKKQAH